MNSKLFIFLIIILIGIIISFGYLNSAKERELDSENFEEGACKSLVYNGNDRIDLLFISSETEAKEYSNFLLDTEPYKSYKGYFNVFFIDSQNPKCDSYRDIAILCNTPEVKDIAKLCPNDYVFVIKNEPPHIRSSSYGNIISINNNVEKSVIVHEFGHAFVNLAEEYYSPSGLPRGSKNCQSSCDSFGNLADSCSQECSKSNLFRSVSLGVMRSLQTTDYGTYNKELILKILEKNKPSESTITGNQIYDEKICKEQDLVSIEITQSQDSILAESTNELSKGCAPDNSGEGETCIGDLCYNLENIFTDTQQGEEEVISGETFEAPEVTTIFIPITGAEVPITSNGNLVATINTAEAGVTACII